MEVPEILVTHELRPTGPEGIDQVWRVEEHRYHAWDDPETTLIAWRGETVINVASQIAALQGQLAVVNGRIIEAQALAAGLEAQLETLAGFPQTSSTRQAPKAVG